jgi:hypothetical protein
MEVKGADFGVAFKYTPGRALHMGENGQSDFERSLRILLPDGADLVVEEGQERDYEVITYDDLGLGMFEVDSEFK